MDEKEMQTPNTEEHVTAEKAEANAILGIADQTQMLTNDKINLQSAIVQENDSDRLKDLTHMFNILQAKKNVIRAGKLDAIYDKAVDILETKIAHNSFEDNDEFLNAFKAVEGALNRAESKVNLVDETPAISLVQQNNTQINVNSIDSLTKESRDRILKAIQAITNPEEEHKDDVIVEDGEEND